MIRQQRPQRIVVGITGATGAILGVRLLEELNRFEVETHLVVSTWGARTIELETGYSVGDVRGLASVTHSIKNLGAEISSGSFLTDGMVVAPCSVKTLSSIATGFGDNLISRAADVALKEQRRLVLMVRETPLNAIHLQNMLAVARLGAIICPPVLTFYNHPRSVADTVDHLVRRTLDLFGLELESDRRWDGHMAKPSDDPAGGMNLA